MKVLLGKLATTLVNLLLPVVIEQLTKVLEEVVKVDIDKDGKIGFESKNDEAVKTVQETVERITNHVDTDYR